MALRVSLAIYHLILNACSWNNSYLTERALFADYSADLLAWYPSSPQVPVVQDQLKHSDYEKEQQLDSTASYNNKEEIVCPK